MNRNRTFYRCAEHIALQAEVGRHLEGLGFAVDELTYHEQMNGFAGQRIKAIDSPACMAVRTAPDLFAISMHDDDAFWVEIKTTRNPSPNIALEAWGLTCNAIKARQWGEDCLYVHRRHDGDTRAFWASELPPLMALHTTGRTQWMARVLPIFLKFLGQSPVVIPKDPNGSCDWYYLIGGKDRDQLPGYRDLLARRLNNRAAPGCRRA